MNRRNTIPGADIACVANLRATHFAADFETVVRSEPDFIMLPERTGSGASREVNDERPSDGNTPPASRSARLEHAVHLD